MSKRKNLKKGYVQVYTGDGKGKTTAALGLAFRAMGAGMRTYIGQFMKGVHYGELDSAKAAAPHITIEQYGSKKFVCLGEKDPKEVERAKKGLEKIRKAMSSGEYDIVVLDEACTALHFGLIEVSEVLELLKARPKNIELILTGRGAPQEIIDAADLVTEMKKIKHYYQKDVPARAGIEK
ncbi:MAG: cob(I)yrinic acid a,c-diamide adenosyltransferase [bacterium]